MPVPPTLSDHPVPDYPPAEPNLEPIDHGDRRDEVHYEDKPGMSGRASHLFRPPDAHMLDVGVLQERPSVWDASPPDEA